MKRNMLRKAPLLSIIITGVMIGTTAGQVRADEPFKTITHPRNLPSQKEASLYPREWTTYGSNPGRNPVFSSPRSAPDWFQKGVRWDFSGAGALPLHSKPLSGKNNVTAYAVGMPVGVSVVRGILLVGDDNGYTYAINARTGKRIWSHYGWNMTMSNPLVSHGRVFVSTGNPYFNYANTVRFAEGKRAVRGPGLNTLYCLDLKTGKVLWSATTAGEMMATATIVGSSLWVATGAGHINGYQLSDGKRIAHLDIRSFDSMSSLVAGDKAVYLGVSHPSRFLSYSPSENKVRWSRTFKNLYKTGMGDCTPAFADHLVVSEATVRSGDPKRPLRNVLFALSASTGKILWKKSFSPGQVPPSMKTATPLIVHGIVYATSPVSREMVAVDLHHGKPVWKQSVDAPARTAGIVTGNHLIIPTSGGAIEVRNTRTGALEKESQIGGAFGPATPVIVGGTLYESSVYGHVLAIPLSSLLH